MTFRTWTRGWALALPGVINVSRGDVPGETVFTIRDDTPNSTLDAIEDARPVGYVARIDRRETRAVA